MAKSEPWNAPDLVPSVPYSDVPRAKVYVDDVDQHFERARAEGAVVVSEPQDGFWGGRTCRALIVGPAGAEP